VIFLPIFIIFFKIIQLSPEEKFSKTLLKIKMFIFFTSLLDRIIIETNYVVKYNVPAKMASLYRMYR